MSGPIEEQLNEIFGDDKKTAAGPNTRDVLEVGHAMRLVRRTGAMKMRPPERPKGTNIMGIDIPCAGGLWDVYERLF